MGLAAREGVTTVMDKGGESWSRQKASLEGNKVLTPWKQRGKDGWVVRVSDCSAVPRESQPNQRGVLEPSYPWKESHVAEELAHICTCIVLSHCGICDLSANAVVYSVEQLLGP